MNLLELGERLVNFRHISSTKQNIERGKDTGSNQLLSAGVWKVTQFSSNYTFQKREKG